MKNKLLVLLTVVVLLFSLTLPVFATELKMVTFSDDFKTLIFNDETYSRINSNNKIYHFGSIYDYEFNIGEYEEGFYYEYSDSYTDIEVEEKFEEKFFCDLTEEQKNSVIDIDIVDLHNNQILFDVSIYYKDGSVLQVNYMRDDYIAKYNELLKSNDNTKMYLDLLFETEEDVLIFEKGDLNLGDKEKIDVNDISDFFDIVSYSDDETLNIYGGMLIIVDSDYYFVDINSPKYAKEEYFDLYSYSYVEAYKINNEELCEKFEEDIDDFYNDSFNYIYDDELLEGLTKILLTIVFLVLPLALFVLFLILWIKSKEKKYKKIYFVLDVIAVIQVILFFVTNHFMFK